MMTTSTTLDTSGLKLQRQLLQRLANAAVASSGRLAEEISQTFAAIDSHLQYPRRASWGADCEWLLSGLQATSRTALDLLVYVGHRTQAESEGIQRRLMVTIQLARAQAQAAGDTVAPIIAASRITSLVARAKEDVTSFYDDLRDARALEHEPRQRAL
ncbi:hypothetical protein K2O51_31205 (plasmid) [Cupriavidus pinatubonensis]|uniref:hypothetical protein n=1 Tax=Cupriavidus pinatubonensis TaxID=248026 RepID=UPI001C739F2A|nr:hypothetical protein [Cupriavidus pinatubonensis]QYY33713.1 hypothetical protein K2O51_31205 [Cupriavidus pinatubonensis]